MKMITEHLGEIIIALVVLVLLVTAVWTFKGPLDGFFDNVADRLTQPTEPDIGDSGGGEVTEPEAVPPYTYEVTYHSNGGTGTMEPSRFTSGTIVNLPANKFTKTGYTFSGWATTATGNVVWADEAAVKNLGSSAGDVVELHAVWRPNPFVIEFHANGGMGTMERLPMTYDVEQALPENTFSRDGYGFVGWNTKEDGSGAAYADQASVKNLATSGTVKLYAQWSQGTYNVTYTLNGGTLPAGSKDTYSSAEDFVLPVPVKNGYTFIGWTGSNGGVPQIDVTIPKGSTGDKAYTANWVISMYDITYHTNGGTMPSTATRSYTIDDTITLPKPTMDGYTFGGWYTNENLTGSVVTQISKGSTGDKVFYAKWTSNEAAYEVNYWIQRLDAGTEKNDENYFVHSSVRTTASAGESITPAVKSIAGFRAPATQTVTVAADGSTVVNYYYTRNSYRFVLTKADGVTTVGSSPMGQYQYGATITLKGAVDAGYTWSKWSSSNSNLVADKTERETTFLMPAGSVTITPVATLNSYTITYHLNGGTQGNNAAAKYDVTTAVTLPTPSKDGYTFGGWYVNEDLNGTTVTEIAKGSTGNKEFWAKWIVNKLDVTASGYTGIYDGKAHGITVSCDGATITYATEENGTYGATNPTFKDAGTYTVYYKVVKAGYTTVTGSKQVVINKASIDVNALPSQDGALTYNGEEQAPEWKNYDESKLTLGGAVKGTDAGTYTATFTPSKNYQWSDGATGPKPVTWKIGKADGKVELSATEGTLTYPATGTFKVTENASGGELSVKSSDEDVATVTIKDGVVTVKSGTKAGEATITVTSAATDNYKAASTTYTVTVKNGGLNVSASGYTGTYDGKGHGITVTCDGATITYATSENGTYLVLCPIYMDAGTYTVYYKVEKAGYQTVTGSEQVVINKAAINTAPSQNGTLTYNGEEQAPSWKNYDSKKLTLGGTTKGTNAGTYSATFTPKANYQWSDGTTGAKTVSWKIVNGTLDVEAKGWSGEYDGEAHGISVKCDGATITYATSANGTYSSTNPTYTALGTYTVYYKVEKTGYTTVTGSAKVVIQDTTPPELTVEYKLPDGGGSGGTHVSAEGEILDSWAEIGAGTYASEYVLGNWKSFQLTTGETVVMEIVAKDADDLADGSGKAALTWISKGVVTNHTMNSTSTNANGWKASEMRTWLQGEFYETIPEEVRKFIVQVEKSYYDYTTKSTLSCEDTVWIPSYREIFGNSSNNSSYELSGVDYTGYFTDATSRIKYNSSGSTAPWWWLRSAGSSNSRGFMSVSSGGGSGSRGATTSDYVVFGFCTDVSAVGNSGFGSGSGGSEPVLGTVVIYYDVGRAEYTYELGMTWADLVNSKYNTDNTLVITSSNTITIKGGSAGPCAGAIAVTSDLPVDYASSYTFEMMNDAIVYRAGDVTGGTTGWTPGGSGSSGSSATLIGNVTDSDRLTVYGTVSDSGSGVDTVVVTVGGKDYVAEIDVDGNWSVDVDLAIGENAIEVIAKDKAGNSTAKDVSVTRCELEVDDDGGVSGVVPPAEEPEEVPEIPEEKLPEIIEFTGGKFDKNTSYTPGTYQDVPYEITYTRTKYPVSYQNILWSRWEWEEDAEGNKSNIRPKEISFDDIDKQYSTWIVYDFETDRALDMDGVKGDSVELWTVYNTSDDTLEHAVYLAAYLNNLDGKTSRHIAKWNGTKYEPYDADGAVAAVKVFTETYTVTGTNRVQITAPSTTTDYVYIPGSTMKAEKGMTWAEWLVSEYNTTGLTEPVIRDVDYNEISYDTEIVAGESYSIMEETTGHVSAEGEILDSWAEIGAGTYASEYALGNWKSFTLTTGETVVMEIVAKDADEKADGSGKAALTWIARDIVTTHKMNSSATNANGWAASEMRTWLQGEFYETIPEEVRKVIVPVEKSYYDYTTKSTLNCEDTVWIPSYREIFGNSSNSAIYETSGADYTERFKDATSRIKYNSSGSAAVWWLRTANAYYSNYFRHVTSGGGNTSTNYSAGSSIGVVPGFCTDVAEKKLAAGLYDANDNLLASWDELVNEYGLDISHDYTPFDAMNSPNRFPNIVQDNVELSTGVMLVLDDSVTHIGALALQTSDTLISVVISDSVSSIGNMAFSGCRELTSVTIGQAVTNIGSYAFRGCTGLTSITFEGTVEQWNIISLGESWNFGVPATEVKCSNGTVSLG